MALFGGNVSGRPGLLTRGLGLFGGLLAAPAVGYAYGVDRLIRTMMPESAKRADAERDTEIEYRRALVDRLKQEENRLRQDDEAAAMQAQELSRNRAMFDSVERYKAKWADKNKSFGRANVSPLLQNTQQQTTRNMARLGDEEAAEMLNQQIAQQARASTPYSVTEQAGPFGSRIVTDGSRFQLVEPPRVQPSSAPSAGDGNSPTGAPSKPLPAKALTLVDEAQQAIAAASESKALVDNAIATIEGGKVKLGAAQNLASRGKNFAGLSDDNSRAFADILQTFEKLRNNYLLLAKGVQTEGDATRAWNSEIGENVQNDNLLALQQLRKAQAMIDRAISTQKARIETTYRNYGIEPPQSSGEAPGNSMAPPAPGDVVDGYRFRGGNPADPLNWQKVK